MMPINSMDKTNFVQSLMHMIKGNFGTGILAMPASFNHCGLINALVGLPVLCIIAAYCVHLLVRSSQHLESKLNWAPGTLDYSDLAKGAFKTGPKWIRPLSGCMCRLVDVVLVLCQMGICCVYLVFIVENSVAVLGTSFQVHISKNYMFLFILPIALLLSYIRTLRRLAIASACANFIQVIGISIIIEFLLREMPTEHNIVLFKPVSEVALGFGSAMFAFEGIAVVMPIYARMKRQEQMGGLCGVINVSFLVLLCLYFIVGLFGYMRFGSLAAGSITLNLPKQPLYEMVRAMFAISLFLTYPLQFYVLNETVWSWFCGRFLLAKTNEDSLKATTATSSATTKAAYEYCCRTVLVLISFMIAMSVPKLNLMMDFFGSISGTSLSITLPPLIHLVAFWEDTSGKSRWFLAVFDGAIIVFGLVASLNGSYFSLIEIIESFEL